MKIGFFLDKSKEFEDSLEKTHEMLKKFENEILKVIIFIY